MAKANVQENITQHKKNVFCLALFWLKWKSKCTRKYYTTQKNFFSIILIEITKGNVQENITQQKKNIFFTLFLIEMATANVQENIITQTTCF